MSVAGYSIRSGREGDLADVVAMERAIAGAPHWAETEYRAAIGEARGSGVRRCLLIAEESGHRLIGFAVGKVMGEGAETLGELESVAVEPNARRGGVGRALCSAVVLWCREQGGRAVELEVRAGSGGAIALYADLGFVSVGRRRGYYRAPVEDAVLMLLELEGIISTLPVPNGVW